MAKRKSIRRGTLAISLTLAVVIIFAVCQSMMWIWLLRQLRNDRMEMLEEHMSKIATFVSATAAPALKSGDEASVQRIVDAASADLDVLSIRVLDRDGKRMAHVVSAVQESMGTLNPFYVPWKSELEMPITLAGANVGTVQVVYNGERTNRKMLWIMTMPALLQMLVAALFVLSIFAFIQRRIGIPIQRIRQALERVTAGDLTVEVPEVVDEELGTIADGIGITVKRMGAAVNRLNSTAQTVSETMDKMQSVFNGSLDRLRRHMSFTQQIAQHIKKADDSMAAVASGSESLTELTRENTASMEEFKASEAGIVKSVDTLFESSDNSYTTVLQITQATNIMNENVQRVLSSVENTSASLQQIIASVREVETGARESSTLADSVRVVAAKQGVATVDRAVKGMVLIAERVKYTSEIIQRLGGRSKDIERMLSVIREVTEQTNMLSINASILAEQAGEFGKGFYVVANEMRQLSDRTASYTKEIAQIVITIQKEIGEAVVSIGSGIKMVDEGSASVYEMGESMSTILESAHKSAHMTKMIERATEDQVTALRHIEAAIIDVNSMSLEMTSAMDDLNKSALFMRDRAGEIRAVAEDTKRSTADMSSGAKFISKNLEQSFSQVASITDSVKYQRKQSHEIVDEVEAIRASSSIVMKEMEGMAESMKRLKDEFEALKNEMGAFKT